MDSFGLTYPSMEHLLKNASLNEQQVRLYEQKSMDAVFNSCKNMQDGAKKARGDIEEQYRLYLLSGELATLMTKNTKFDKWIKDKANAALFRSTYENVVEEASKLQTMLKMKYEAAQVRRDKQDRAVKQEAEKRVSSSSSSSQGAMRAIRALITPRELIRKVENEEPKKSALIFDLRQNQSDAIFYNRSEMITVIQVPYDLIDSSLTFQSLKNNLPVNQRALLPRVSGSDYVVLMDDESPELLNNSPAPKTKMSFLFKALTQYNSVDRLRDRPMFMDGGFKLWKAQYPTYTKDEQPLSSRTSPSDGLDQAILDYTSRSYGVSEIRYPDLMSKLSLSESLAPGQPLSPPRIPPRPADIPPEPYSEPPRNGGIGSGGIYPQAPTIPQRPIIPPTTIPPSIPTTTTFDRPGPPIFSPAPPGPPTVIPPKPYQPPPPVFPIPDRTSKPSTMPPDVSASDPSLARQNGGIDVKRPPPMLDRNTKPATISKEYEVQILSIYDQMTMAIDRSIDERTKSRGAGLPGAVGLYNMGNTCFMSATLQCLFQTPGLPEVFTRRNFVSQLNTQNTYGSKGVISAGFASLLDTIWTGPFQAIRPARFLQLFADEVYRNLNDGRQHDASEFQLFLLDALHEDTNQGKRISFEQNYKGGQGIRQEAADFLRKHYQFTMSPVNRILGTITVAEVRCLTCGESSATFEENTIVSVEITSNTSCTLDNCLRSHFSQTKLEGDSAWNCPKCKTPRTSTRTSKLWQPPPVLVIHLKRFALFYGDFEKNTASVAFDAARFDIRPYLHEAAPTDKPFYKLYAATLHNGRLNSGHYTSVASHLRNDKWHRYDDETVTPCEKFQVNPQLAYILFYKRC
ncbi:hypothetical protein L5515_009857 [Caenorhabditis briggsae]|uniref:ubiquitinyl hydrolase 1 n=1 Tax=Caenorhabditis briggsae TaxID=6238 RepID=A0AAE9JP84_CAEBR|nr:hypothetical protein L5515_009857 [Caenorhabditis briggsae]